MFSDSKPMATLVNYKCKSVIKLIPDYAKASQLPILSTTDAHNYRIYFTTNHVNMLGPIRAILGHDSPHRNRLISLLVSDPLFPLFFPFVFFFLHRKGSLLSSRTCRLMTFLAEFLADFVQF